MLVWCVCDVVLLLLVNGVEIVFASSWMGGCLFDDVLWVLDVAYCCYVVFLRLFIVC